MLKKALVISAALTLPLIANAFPGDGEGPAEHRVERMSKELQLTPDQKSKLEVIFKEQHEKFRAIHEESHNRISQILTPEQSKKFEEMKKQHQQQRREKMKGQKPQP